MVDGYNVVARLPVVHEVGREVIAVAAIMTVGLHLAEGRRGIAQHFRIVLGSNVAALAVVVGMLYGKYGVWREVVASSHHRALAVLITLEALYERAFHTRVVVLGVFCQLGVSPVVRERPIAISRPFAFANFNIHSWQRKALCAAHHVARCSYREPSAVVLAVESNLDDGCFHCSGTFLGTTSGNYLQLLYVFSPQVA